MENKKSIIVTSFEALERNSLTGECEKHSEFSSSYSVFDTVEEAKAYAFSIEKECEKNDEVIYIDEEERDENDYIVSNDNIDYIDNVPLRVEETRKTQLGELKKMLYAILDDCIDRNINDIAMASVQSIINHMRGNYDYDQILNDELINLESISDEGNYEFYGSFDSDDVGGFLKKICDKNNIDYIDNYGFRK